jgi:hypothetical protein
LTVLNYRLPFAAQYQYNISTFFLMRIPSENLDDYRKPADPKDPPPARYVALGLSGETEVLTPLAVWDGYVKGSSRTSLHRLSWFHRSLAMSGAVVVIGLMVVTGAFLKMYGPPSASTDNLNSSVVSPTETSAEVQTNEIAETSDDVDDSDSLIDENSPSAFMAPDTLPTAAKRRTYRPRVNRATARPSVFFAANRVRRHLFPRPQFIVSDFVPTTLVIYVDKGQIKTRIEPQLTAAYKRAPASSQQ